MGTSGCERFWPALEAVPGLAAVRAEWEHHTGAFEQVKPFLRVQVGRARWFPNFDGGLPFEVHDHGQGEIVGVCAETGRTIPLTPAQLIVYELDRRRLGSTVAAVLGIEAGGTDPGTTTHLGHFTSAAQTRYGCFLTIPTESADVQVVATRLIAEGSAPFVLFAPTRRWLRRGVETLLKFHGCAFVALSEAVSVPEPGRLVANRSLDVTLARVTGVVRAGTTTGSEVGRNVFRRDGKTWTIVFEGKQVSLVDSLGVRCLAHLLASKRRDVDVAVLKAVATGNEPVKPLSGIEALDPEARKQYRSAYEDLVIQLEEAEKLGDAARQEHIREQMALLVGELESAHGLGGRARKTKDPSASTRTSVKNAIDRALALLKDKHPALYRHLDTSVTTGATLRYDPVPDVEWDL
jgi:hypothetical protein